jgi:hypothetical protein
MWYDAILEIAHAVWKNGLSVGTIGTVVYVLLKFRKIKQRLRRYLPFLFDDSEMKTYVENQHVIMENQRRIMAALGVLPACPENAHTWRTSSDSASGRRMSSIFSWAARLRAHAAAARAKLSITKSNISNRRMKIMKKWIKPDSLTVIGGVIAAAVSKYFGFEIDPANILGAVVLLVGYIKAHELVTVTRDANGLPSGFRVNSRKTIFTAVGFAVMVANVAFGWNLSLELILTLSAGITGYNYFEATKDVKAAEAEAADAKQTY